MNTSIASLATTSLSDDDRARMEKDVDKANKQSKDDAQARGGA